MQKTQSHGNTIAYLRKSCRQKKLNLLAKLTACKTELKSCSKPTTVHNADITVPAKILLVPSPEPWGKFDQVFKMKPPPYLCFKKSFNDSPVLTRGRISAQKNAAFNKAPNDEIKKCCEASESIKLLFCRKPPQKIMN